MPLLVVLAAFYDEEIEVQGSEATHSEPRDSELVGSGFHAHPLPGEGHPGPVLPLSHRASFRHQEASPHCPWGVHCPGELFSQLVI